MLTVAAQTSIIKTRVECRMSTTETCTSRSHRLTEKDRQKYMAKIEFNTKRGQSK